MADQDIRPDGTVAFLPHRLNRHPVVVLGLTADELWVCAGLSGALGLVAGLPLAIALATIAVVPTTIVLAISLGVFAGGSTLRRLKRGRPDTWLYRQLQWRVALRQPLLAPFAPFAPFSPFSPFSPFVGGHALVTRSGWWSTRRSHSP